MNLLLTGASGKLGTALQKLRHYEYTPSHQDLDITHYDSVLEFLESTRDGRDLDLIVHCAAYTNVKKAQEEDRRECWQTNVEGTDNLRLLHKPILYISTEYVFDGGQLESYKEDDIPNPTNFYGLTKLIGEERVARSGNYARILRLIFKPRPWPFEYAYSNQFTSGDYVDVMAREVDKAITLYNELPRILHIGTGRKSMLELARQTKPDVKPNLVPPDYPLDCSLNTSAWEQIKKENHL